MRRLTRRRGEPLAPTPASEAIARISALRYKMDSAREPESYPDRSVAKVLREEEDVMVLIDRAGEVLTRYRLLSAPINRGFWHPERQAYAMLEEL